MSDAEGVAFSLKVMINKARTKVLFAEADSSFTDILVSFLTLPLGRIVKILEKHYGEKAPLIGSLTSLYRGLANLDHAHFWTKGAKQILVNPVSSFEADYRKLKLDISDYQPEEIFFCEGMYCGFKFLSASIYYDVMAKCSSCGRYQSMNREVAAKMESPASVCYEGVFMKKTGSFVISDDLRIVSNVTGLLQTISVFGIADACEAELMNVTFGFNEIMDLLKASLTSPTPLSDLILNKTNHINSATTKFEQVSLSTDKIAASNHEKMILKVMVQKPANKLLFAQAEEDFIEFLFSFLTIPLGGAVCLLAKKASIKSIDNLYRSISDLLDDKYFKTLDTKNKLIKPKQPHGYISKAHIFSLTEETLPHFYNDTSLFSSVNFPKGQGKYLEGPRTYKVTDDLTVTPFCVASILSNLNELRIPLSDVEELELHIGLEEGLNILKASLTSTSALTNGLGLMNHKSKKQKQEL